MYTHVRIFRDIPKIPDIPRNVTTSLPANTVHTVTMAMFEDALCYALQVP